MSLPVKLQELLKRQHYHLIGKYKHAAVKSCHWLRAALTRREFCYKRWYGIQSHRCCQMTPILSCPNACLHCWRFERLDPGAKWDELNLGALDEPSLIVKEAIEEQRRILSGYKKNPKVDPRMYEEALHPKHFAISLAGEPTLYPYISDLLRECHQHGVTTFLVTNGMYPKVLSTLDEEPSQLYVSVNAPSEALFKTVCRPSLPDAWSRLLTSLEQLQSFKCPTAIRITLVAGLNADKPQEYAYLVKIAQPTYVEVKAYMYLGFSRYRLRLENMPKHEHVKSFAKTLAEATGYRVLAESLHSRVVLLSRLEKPIKVA